jgi:hypothetical protein
VYLRILKVNYKMISFFYKFVNLIPKTMMENIIPEVPKELIEAELTEARFIRKTNNAGNLLYIITAEDSPNTMREIGRLREMTFRAAGGGTGKAVDIDDFDIGEDAYRQLIVWDPSEREILGGYRFHICNENNCLIDGED